jgi:hypothetical protein
MRQDEVMSDGKFYFCTKHHLVEGSDGCGPMDRLGPYPTREEAERALEKVRERNEEWDNDPNWNDQGPGSGPVGR